MGQSCQPHQPWNSWFSLYLATLFSPEIPTSRLVFELTVYLMQTRALELFTYHCNMRNTDHLGHQWIHASTANMLVMAEAKKHPLMTCRFVPVPVWKHCYVKLHNFTLSNVNVTAHEMMWPSSYNSSLLLETQISGLCSVNEDQWLLLSPYRLWFINKLKVAMNVYIAFCSAFLQLLHFDGQHLAQIILCTLLLILY